jgi:hypothetical protein
MLMGLVEEGPSLCQDGNCLKSYLRPVGGRVVMAIVVVAVAPASVFLDVVSFCR